ncbi:hypothetical protein JAAARDRAFT_28510 [Jaapia argillacea MUCL 33604]|uniref:Uncharacterized protein n=1 Tax=Jaapia argillacea MUCL 33604 TaxID=933084 RepID=A0A067QD12_9AGAM|nr:hypothetical protein JAAARDRAFT_28510 [Jaapia argillacea MUCL 33604]
MHSPSILTSTSSPVSPTKRSSSRSSVSYDEKPTAFVFTSSRYPSSSSPHFTFPSGSPRKPTLSPRQLQTHSQDAVDLRPSFTSNEVPAMLHSPPGFIPLSTSRSRSSSDSRSSTSSNRSSISEIYFPNLPAIPSPPTTPPSPEVTEAYSTVRPRTPDLTPKNSFDLRRLDLTTMLPSPISTSSSSSNIPTPSWETERPSYPLPTPNLGVIDLPVRTPPTPTTPPQTTHHSTHSPNHPAHPPNQHSATRTAHTSHRNLSLTELCDFFGFGLNGTSKPLPTNPHSASLPSAADFLHLPSPNTTPTSHSLRRTLSSADSQRSA